MNTNHEEQHVQDHLDAVDALSSTMEGLELLCQSLKAQAVPMDTMTAQFFGLAFEAHGGIAGLTQRQLPPAVSYNSAKKAEIATALSMETLKESISKAWAAFKEMVRSIVAKIRSWFSSAKSDIKKHEESVAKELETAVQHSTSVRDQATDRINKLGDLTSATVDIGDSAYDLVVDKRFPSKEALNTEMEKLLKDLADKTKDIHEINEFIVYSASKTDSELEDLESLAKSPEALQQINDAYKRMCDQSDINMDVMPPIGQYGWHMSIPHAATPEEKLQALLSCRVQGIVHKPGYHTVVPRLHVEDIKVVHTNLQNAVKLADELEHGLDKADRGLEALLKSADTSNLAPLTQKIIRATFMLFRNGTSTARFEVENLRRVTAALAHYVHVSLHNAGPAEHAQAA